MKLKKWLDKNKIKHIDFAKKLKIDNSTLTRYINGERKVPLITALKIERATQGEVECKDLV